MNKQEIHYYRVLNLIKTGEEILTSSIREWVNENKPIFWKYEVSFKRIAYLITVSNLPDPSAKDIMTLPLIRSLSGDKKNQLCANIKTACENAGILEIPSLKVRLENNDGIITATLCS
jgi:hypothetical protein